MAGSAGAGGIAMVKKMPRTAASSSLGGPPTSNSETQKARAHMLSNFCHGARPMLWRRREWLAALELLAFKWRK
jgi:hypothetical protein